MFCPKLVQSVHAAVPLHHLQCLKSLVVVDRNKRRKSIFGYFIGPPIPNRGFSSEKKKLVSSTTMMWTSKAGVSKWLKMWKKGAAILYWTSWVVELFYFLPRVSWLTHALSEGFNIWMFNKIELEWLYIPTKTYLGTLEMRQTSWLIFYTWSRPLLMICYFRGYSFRWNCYKFQVAKCKITLVCFLE